MKKFILADHTKKIYESLYFVFFVVLFTVLISLYLPNINTPYQHFTLQAQSFLQGKLDIPPQTEDTVILNGKHYWPQGPFPSVVLLPFAFLFKNGFTQSHMQPILILIVAVTIYKLARLKKFTAKSSVFLCIAFLFGSTVAGIIINPRSWYFAQVVTVTLLCIFMYELETKKRPVILGLLLGGLLATRPTAAFIFFIALIKLVKEKYGIKKIIYFIIPIIIFLSFVFFLNFLRFGNPIDTGYATNEIISAQKPQRDLGILNIQHIPTNFYLYFLTSVSPILTNDSVHLKFPFITYDQWGLSFFIVSPFFLYSIGSIKKKNYYTKGLWITIICTLLFFLIYYSPGVSQFGPRYTVDFLPLLFLLTLNGLKAKELTIKHKIVIVLSSLLNCYLLLSPYISA